ncbi:NADH:flavin oxidoreductase/NADH oxidase family protein [Pseudovirgaria hyperparasitica]|uniref:NADH:flavin oxidoreductase/NADH oxidase family protein n=1 Tax=Pseudovirgaria hyperparasitica TaxID=470096 RepID=A0A6A6W8G8_9PEZI|nr:NADH:flavin oxidoreductase/NADH oxidase family protein [Pseudovirgaria hyperparasitica]KAF2758250.1 NADH:flavin oxidoreductase/NADH oxidase family protein [Pseudovirgaria hyperparasitica]
MSIDKLFKPIKLGGLNLDHRVIMAPLTRFRADESHTPSPDAKEYYAQRASSPGTLLITEATFISPRCGGYDRIPGIWNYGQRAAWKEITDAVHAKGCYIYCQLWALGRVANEDVLARDGFDVQSASDVPVDETKPTPKPLTEDDIKLVIQDYVDAAENAMIAGFDGVELHGANGYLIDQFWQDVTNKRTDTYGGSIENRARFGIEVTKAVIAAVGDSKKVAMRLSPWATGQRMKMEDPVPQFSHIIQELKKLNLSYLHLVESRVGYNTTAVDGDYHVLTRENDKFVELWGTEAPIMLAGGFTEEKAAKVVNEVYTADNVTIAFGRYYISTPDLPYRIKRGIPLNKYNRETFYSSGPEGYIDYPFSKEYLAELKA